MVGFGRREVFSFELKEKKKWLLVEGRRKWLEVLPCVENEMVVGGERRWQWG